MCIRDRWDIVFALTGEFFSGIGQHGDALRTLFVVGDYKHCLLYTSDAADERSSVDLGGRRIIKKKNSKKIRKKQTKP